VFVSWTSSLNIGPPKCESGVLIILSQPLVTVMLKY